jgi:integrase
MDAKQSLTTAGRPPGRRTRVERNLYERYNSAGERKFELGYRDWRGRQRWQTVTEPGKKEATLRFARGERDRLLGRRQAGEHVEPSPKLRFEPAVEKWLADEVSELRPATQSAYRYAAAHAMGRWSRRRLDSIEPDDCAELVKALRREGLSEATIAGVVRATSAVFKFAKRRLRWRGENPVPLLSRQERPRAGGTERRIYERDELAQTIAAAGEPWATLFRLASVVGARESELLGLWWDDLDLADLDLATVRFTHQVDRRGVRVQLKTDESKAVLPLPRSTAAMLLEHKARSLHTGPRAFVFATRTGRPLGQRNVLRALYRAQERARDSEGRPTFPDLFEHDEHGHLAVDDQGDYVARRVDRRELDLPDFHATRHAAAMDCEEPRRRATCCATRTRTSPGPCTGRTSATAGASCCARSWKRDMDGRWRRRPKPGRPTWSTFGRRADGSRADRHARRVPVRY